MGKLLPGDREFPWDKPRPVCVVCGGEITRWTRGRRHCSWGCRQKEKRERQCGGTAILPTGHVGAISELVVAADLLGRGFDVFRSLSPHGQCDLLICKRGANSDYLRVEVTTGHHRGAGGVSHSKQRATHKFDLLAVVDREDGNRIYYEPEGLLEATLQP